jgi:hypothetical protein
LPNTSFSYFSSVSAIDSPTHRHHLEEHFALCPASTASCSTTDAAAQRSSKSKLKIEIDTLAVILHHVVHVISDARVDELEKQQNHNGLSSSSSETVV